jgi:uracil-DNA glycosylase family 4
MTLELDSRQRAMLQEMGVHVWLPEPVSVCAAETTSTSVLPSAPALAPTTPSPLAPHTRPLLVPAKVPLAALPAVRVTPGEPLDLQDMDWQTLAQTAASCQACGLCAGRKSTTLQPRAHPVQTDWMVVGEPPDEDEDRLGQAFAEATGHLMDNMLKACGVNRQTAYLTNVVKCRPPQGRLPLAADLQQCAQYLQREIALVQPKMIIAMGRFATQILLSEHPAQAALPLDKQRGVVYRYGGTPVVVTYHPKVLLRASANKAKAWADLCLAMDVVQGAA